MLSTLTAFTLILMLQADNGEGRARLWQGLNCTADCKMSKFWMLAYKVQPFLTFHSTVLPPAIPPVEEITPRPAVLFHGNYIYALFAAVVISE